MEWDLLKEDFESEYFEDTFTVIIIYDIISNKRRTYLYNLLKAFGHSIQKSAFECILTREKCELMMKKIDRFAEKGDLIRIYKLNQNVKTTIYGENVEDDIKEDFYFF